MLLRITACAAVLLAFSPSARATDTESMIRTLDRVLQSAGKLGNEHYSQDIPRFVTALNRLDARLDKANKAAKKKGKRLTKAQRTVRKAVKDAITTMEKSKRLQIRYGSQGLLSPPIVCGVKTVVKDLVRTGLNLAGAKEPRPAQIMTTDISQNILSWGRIPGRSHQRSGCLSLGIKDHRKYNPKYFSQPRRSHR